MRRSPRLPALAAFALLALFGLAMFLALPAAATQRVEIDGRFYLVDLPARPQGAALIVALHGGGGDPAQFAASSGLGQAATAAGYAVVFPAGSSRRGAERLLTWNGGYCCGFAARRGVADEAFLKAVIADAQRRFGLDGARVFVTGMSNGSILAETFAAQNPGAVRALAGVSGSMDAARVRVAGPVPVLLIHGTADRMVPYGGGQGSRSATRTDFASVASVLAAFLAAQPGVLAQTERRLEMGAGDATAVRVTDWTAGGKARLRLITIEGGAHVWPGAARLSAGKTQGISATAEILRFFDQYR